MTTAVKELLNTFDALTDTEKREAATRLLRRVLVGESGDVTEDVLVLHLRNCSSNLTLGRLLVANPNRGEV